MKPRKRLLRIPFRVLIVPTVNYPLFLRTMKIANNRAAQR